MGGRLEGKVALISGGASGLGEAQAMLYAREGATVMIGDLQEALGAAVVAKIAEAGGAAAFTRLDVTDLASWQAAVALTVKTFGKLTTLVNNAGIFHPGGIIDETPEGWAKMVAVNQTGVFYGMKAGAPELVKAGTGSAIVNISSLYGLIGSPGAISYHASKAAVRVMGKGAALEFVKQGVRVTRFSPARSARPFWAISRPNRMPRSRLRSRWV